MLNIKLSQIIPKLLGDMLVDIKIIYLFGSHASNSVMVLSDIDIAVLTRSKLSSIKRWQVQSELANVLATEVDLVDLLTASTVMQNQIIQKGICIYDFENSAAFFEMQVMSMYQHLNVERADILKQYLSIETES
ncbi:type VII toxin-antitoxin system MntA family adenylyltransferase antitoxin [Candidatus Colwellia aromaticivorans]|uniref:type VII toxin-antitoxin system MntA family adenylyltransferase antitoxin n=1 Tax=Candidatus Colwellia aromaticivorans TaxID=2267621 RepID=UPI000DF4802E|nr:nucleotidyltransferase domain-containing protein [Candidatus Colwellia aromaticivorans]